MTETSLIKINELKRQIAEVRSLEELIEIRDRAAAVSQYAKAKNLASMANDAKEAQLVAERKAGEFLAIRDKAQGAATPQTRFQAGTALPPTYAELGIAKTTAHRWQIVAEVPERQFEEYIAKRKSNGRELTATGIYRLAKELRRERQREENREIIEQAISPIVEGQTFATIVLDPPWDWGDEGDIDQLGRARPTYGTMPIAEIEALPIPDLATENAHIYLWITNRSLPKGFDLLGAWGFRYVTTLTWCKPHFGMGNYFRGSTEHVLFGVKGSLPLLRHDVGTWFAAPRPGKHSSKPPEFYELVESCSPGPWLDMFARLERPGWAVWGAEVGRI